MIIVVALINIALGVLVILLSLPMLLHKLPRNRFYGARFPKSYESEENWYQINEATAKYMMVWSGVLLAISAALLAVPVPQDDWFAVLASFAPIVLLVGALQSWLFAKRY